MIKKLGLYMTSIALLILTTGCLGYQSGSVGIGDDETKKTEIRLLAEQFLSGEMSIEAFNALDLDTQIAIVEYTSVPPTQEQMAQWRRQDEDWQTSNVEHIIRGDFRPAIDDIDLYRIERFVFTFGSASGGEGLVIDKRYGRVYYDPHAESNGLSVVHLDSVEISALFIDEDHERLIQAIEKSNLRNWEEIYHIDFDERIHGVGGGIGWIVGVQFDDGTILRRSGNGFRMFDDGFPPQYQFKVLIDFVEAIGKEIIERHNVETKRSE